MKKSFVVILCLVAMVSACGSKDPNAKAEYGESGLPKNCRAYVQTAINDYKAKKYSPDEIMAGLERNCGEHGISWNP